MGVLGRLLLLLLAARPPPGGAFRCGPPPPSAGRTLASSLGLGAEAAEWRGEVVSNDADGRIRGCVIAPVTETEFTVSIDGEEADLGNFGAVVYRKITSDASRQQFRGFRPGTVPPHLLPTYRAYAMNEVARETALEAMQQNAIRPFESARAEMKIEQVSVPPPKRKRKKKRKRKGGGEGKGDASALAEEDAPAAWTTYGTMGEALGAGWEPGQSFSFVAKNCRGQKVEPVSMERPPVI